jgi:hypothetical protein
MRKTFILLILVLAGNSLWSQDSKLIFSSKEIVWYGLDFSKAHFIGTFDQGLGYLTASGYDLKTKWIPEWNGIIVREPTNFDFKKAFRKEIIHYNTTPLAKVNQTIDAIECMSFTPGKISRTAIDSIVANYPDGDFKEGIGVSFIVENIDKTLEVAGVYVTFFDIKTKKVLLCNFLKGEPSGVSLRNYWLGAIKDILKQITKKEYNKWKAAK